MADRAFSAPGWGTAKSSSARPGGQPIGVSFGSQYQTYFSSLADADQQAEINRMKAAGITWARVDVNWSLVQSSSATQYYWGYPDLTVSALIKGGMNVMVILLGSPGWARAIGNNPAVASSPWPTFKPSDFSTFCGEAAAHYGAMGVQVFEIWNEPNLDSQNTSLGMGYLSAQGYASIATAAYTTIHQQYVAAPGTSSIPLVIGGCLAGHRPMNYVDTTDPLDTSVRNVSWAAYTTPPTTATISCTTAAAGDKYKLIWDSTGTWPPGTYVSDVVAGDHYTVSPPSWMSAFPNPITAYAGAIMVDFGFAPDVFLTQCYTQAAGAPMFDALSMHPYAFPELPSEQGYNAGSWAIVPHLRDIMVAHGDGAKAIWFTEVGAPTGAHTASWPAASATATELVVSSSTATPADLGYIVTHPNLPAGAFVASVDADSSWTLLPSTGLTLASALGPGSTITSLNIKATSAVSFPDNTELRVNLGAGTTPPLTVTAAATSIAAGATASVTVASAKVPAAPGGITAFKTGGPVLCLASFGQTWGTAIPAEPLVHPSLTAPGVLESGGLATEAQQTAIIREIFTSIAHGVPGPNGGNATAPWPYVGPVFLFCWSDASINASTGPFGLTRADGTAKTALTVLTALTSHV